MNKILPISNPIFINYDPECDIPLSIFQPRMEDYNYIMLENYINVCISDSEESRNVCFYRKATDFSSFHNNYLYYDIMKSNVQSVSEFFINAINRGYYISFLIDKFYIQNYPSAYNKHHIEHKLFIYGYDLNDNCFFASDYFDMKRGYEKVSFKQIEESFKFFDKYFDTNLYNVVTLQKLNENTIRKADINYVVLELKKFIKSEKLGTEKELYYGFAFFDILLERIYQDENIDIKHYHFINVHIRIMIERLLWISRQYNVIDNQIMDDLDILYKKALLIRNIMFKDRISGKSLSKHRLLNYLNETKIEYKECIKRVIVMLESL